MVSKLRLCRAIQCARASASATVVIASTSTASFSPKIKVDVIGSKPSASPKSFGRSPTIAFPGAVKTFTFSVLDATRAVKRALAGVLSSSSLVPSTLLLLLRPEGLTSQKTIQPERNGTRDWTLVLPIPLYRLRCLHSLDVRLSSARLVLKMNHSHNE